MIIRPAAASDIEALAGLAARTWTEAFGGGLDPDDLATELANRRSPAFFVKAVANTTILVAEDESQLVGYVQVGSVEIPEIDASPRDVALRRLYVDATVQGRGPGRLLIESALALPEVADARRVFLTVGRERARASAVRIARLPKVWNDTLQDRLIRPNGRPDPGPRPAAAPAGLAKRQPRRQ